MNIAATARQIEALLAEYPELIEDDVLRLDMIEGATDAMAIIDTLIERMAEAKVLAAAIGERIAELRARKERIERREDAIRAGLLRLMEVSGTKKIERPAATLSIRAGTPKVVITDEADVPDAFFRVKKEVDKRALLDALKGGLPVLGATLSNPEPTLSVRVA